MAKLAGTSEGMIQISFLVMNLEHLLARVVSCWLFSGWWPSGLVPGKDRLVAKRHADFSDRGGDWLANERGENFPIGGLMVSGGVGGTPFSASSNYTLRGGPASKAGGQAFPQGIVLLIAEWDIAHSRTIATKW